MSLFDFTRFITQASRVLPALVAAFAVGCGDDPPVNTEPCASGKTHCSSECVDTNTDSNHRGGCDFACSADETCSNG